MATLFGALAMAASVSLQAQTNIANYTFTQSTSTYTPITGGTVVVAANTNYDDLNSSAITIPAFPFGGASITTVYVNSNGYITMGGSHNVGEYTPLSTTGTGVSGVVSGLGCDNGYSSGNGTTGATSEIRCQQIGDEFVAQFQDVKRWNSTNERITFQIRLNSTTGTIKIIYGGTIVIGNSTTAPQVGIRGNSTTWSSNVNNLRLLDIPAGTTCNWSNMVTGNNNSATMTLSSSNTAQAPSNGLTYTWTSATAPAPVRTFSAVTNITGNSATVAWTAPTGATQYNIQYRIPGTCAWTNFTGNPVSTATANITGLAPLTSYQVRVQSVSGTNTSIWSHIPSSSGTGDGYSATGTFTTLPTCGQPTAVTVPAASINSTQAVVNWTAPTIGPPTGYKWEVRTSGAAGSGPTGLAATGNSTTATATPNTLTSATTYSVYVRTLCGASDSSIWTSAVNFTTLCTTPAPGATIASISTGLCAGTTVAFSLTTATPGPGVTYQWQSSVDNLTFTNISGATSATYTGPAVAKYYRCMVKCAAGPDSTASGPVQLTYNNNIASTTNVQRCGVGTVDLMASGPASATLKWFAAATGGTAIGTGSPFTTPSINTTTTYYVAAETGAPSTATIGTATTLTGATNQPTAFCNRWKQYWCQMVFTAAELTSAGLTAGNISGITFNINTLGDGTNVTNFRIALGTAPSTLTGFTTNGLTNVYGPATYTHAIGVNTIDFDGYYNWDGTSNILVDIRQTGNDQTNNAQTYFTATTNNTCASATTSSTSPDLSTTSPTASLSMQRLNIVFKQPACSSPRIPVTATVNAPPTFTVTANKTVCNNAITQLTVTSNQSSFNTYIWSPATNLYTDAGATVAYVAGASAATVYHKSATAAATTYTATANNSTTQCAATATVAVTVLPASAVAIATPASICVSGTTSLALTPATGYGAATLQWQSSMNNSTFVDTNGTGVTYTTPVLNSTRYYRAVIKNSDGTVCFNSVSDTAKVYNPLISGTTPATRCGPGTVVLGATTTEGTPKWYAASTGGAPLFTGSSFTTPTIAASTTFYVSGAAGGAAGVATIGAGASTSLSGSPDFSGISPYAYHYGNYKHQMLLTVAELNSAGIAAGQITSLAFDVATAGSPVAAFNNFKITLIPTSQNAMTATFVTGGTPVYSAASVTPTVGINTYTFSTPFIWDGVTNIVVQTCYNNDNSGVVASSAEVKYDNTSFVSQAIYRVDGIQTGGVCDFATANTSNDGPIISKRPKMLLGYNGSCESPRIPVIATVNPLPTIAVTPNGTVQVCTGSTTTLTATGGGTYQWKNASGNIGGQTNAAFTTGNAGTYKVVVTTPATGCFDSSAAITVNVNPIPVVNLGNDTTFCSGNTLTLNAANAGATYLWNDNSTNQTRAVTSTGTYSVKVTNSSNCSKSDTINVTVNPSPVLDLGNDTNICLGVNYVLNAGNPGATYLWDNATTAQTRAVTNTGTYYVRVRNSFNCIARDTVTATFLPTPIVNLGANRDICAGASVTLDAGNPGESYLWDDNSTSQTRTVNTTGTYHVTVSNIANCRGRDTVNVTVHPLPVVNLGNDTVFCHGNTLTLNARNPGASYHWNDNSTNQTLIAGSTGNYNVVVTDGYGCVGTDDINILVKDPPSGNINAVYSNDAIYVFNVLNARYVSGYTWDFGDGSPRVTGAVVQHQYAKNGIYNVTVMLAGECSDSLGRSRTVDVFDATGGTGIPQVNDSKDLLLYPNPARDIVTLENKLNLKMKHITVYNVVGQVIIDSKADSGDKHILHTGTYAPGVYTIRIETERGMVTRKFEIMK